MHPEACCSLYFPFPRVRPLLTEGRFSVLVLSPGTVNDENQVPLCALCRQVYGHT